MLNVVANEIKSNYKGEINFELHIIPEKILSCLETLRYLKPDVGIIYLALKNKFFWPSVHWLKYKNIPFIFWSHGLNLEDPNNIIKNIFFRYIHNIADSIIIYSPNEKKYIHKKNSS